LPINGSFSYGCTRHSFCDTFGIWFERVWREEAVTEEQTKENKEAGLMREANFLFEHICTQLNAYIEIDGMCGVVL